MIMEYQSSHQKESDVVRLLHWYDFEVSDLGSRPVPNYRKFLKGTGNKVNCMANVISNYLENADEHIPHGKSMILAYLQ